MTVNQLLKKLSVKLAASHSVMKLKFAEATLVDGTVLTTDGEFIEGAIVYVQVAEGDAPLAPEGIHETTDGKLITIGASGDITKIEDASTDAPVADPATDVAMEDVSVPVDVAPEAVAATEELLAGIADILAPFTEEIATLTQEVVALKARFNKLADEPAAAPVRNTFSEMKATKDQAFAQRMEAIRAIRKN